MLKLLQPYFLRFVGKCLKSGPPEQLDYAPGHTVRQFQKVLDEPLSAPCKGTVFQWVRIPSGAFAPAGSNRSSRGGNEAAEAFGVEGPERDLAIMQAVT
jgi:hypothetical protein